MAINKLFAATAMAMLESGSAYLDRRMCKGSITHFTDAKKKRKRKAERAARRINRK